MNASSLYVTVFRLVVQNDAPNVYRLFPYLRQSLSCSVCGQLLQEPFSPLNSPCQHHECKTCIGGRKILKPSCSWCRDRQDTVQNVQLRMLLQCYKSLCEYIKLTPIYEGMLSQVQINTSSNSNNGGGGSGDSSAATNRLADIIDEGIRFKDEFKSTAGLSKATYSMLPCLYQSAPSPSPVAATTPPPSSQQQSSNSNAHQVVLQQHQQQILSIPLVLPSTTSTSVTHNNNPQQISSNLLPSSHVLLKNQTGQRTMLHQQQTNHSSLNKQQQNIPSTINQNNGSSIYVTKAHTVPPMPIIKTVSNGSALYSVMYAGSGNKITIKRKTDSQSASANLQMQQQQQQSTSDSGAAGNSSPGEMKANSSASLISQNLFSANNNIVNNSNYTNSNSQDASGSGLGFKKPPVVVRSKVLAKRKGCRCGNATLTPGKLTCCGQRCPCYVESKACIDCKCRGCRNPHRADGLKVRPHIPELENLDFHLNAVEQMQDQMQQGSSIMKTVMNTLNGGGGKGMVSNASATTSTPGQMEVDSDVGGMFQDQASTSAGSSGSNSQEGGLRLGGQHVSSRERIDNTLTNNMNLNTYQGTSSAGNVPPGKIQVLYTTPTSQIGTGLPTIIMSSGGGKGSAHQMQLQQQPTSTSTTYSFMNVQPSNTVNSNSGQSLSSSYLTSNNNASLMSAMSTSTSFNLTGAHNVSWDDLLGSAAVGDEDLEAEGVIIGGYGSDEDESSVVHQLHLNGGTSVDLAVDNSPGEEDEDSEDEMVM